MSIESWFNLTGKIAVITGGSRGLGREMALALAAAGADIAITGRTQKTLDQTKAEIEKLDKRAWTFMADMSQPAECQQTFETIVDSIGAPDVLINNLGNREVNVSIEEEDLETWQKMIDLNLTTCFLGTKIAGAAMLAAKKKGRIINIASISALIANRGIGGRDYETGKAAVLHFTRCAAADWAPHGITVNAICPGLFMTDINRDWNEKKPDVINSFVENIPIGRAGQPAEIGPLAVFLASDASAYMTGTSCVMDGGYTLW